MSVTDYIPFDSKKAAFFDKLNPSSKYKSSGASIPELRKLAKRIKKEEIEIVYIEDILLLAIIIASDNKCFQERKIEFESLTDYLVSWSVTDIFASSLKFSKKEEHLYYEYFLSLCDREDEMSVRLGLVTLKTRFLKAENIDAILSKLVKIQTDHYLLNMGAAWTFSEAIILFPDIALPYYSKASEVIRKLTRKKCLESFRVKGDFRTLIQNLK